VLKRAFSRPCKGRVSKLFLFDVLEAVRALFCLRAKHFELRRTTALVELESSAHRAADKTASYYS